MGANDIDKKHKQYEKNLSKWKMIDDICDSENLQNYLVALNPQDKSNENKIRNDQYFKRAVFAEIAGYTQSGMSGMVFRKWPILHVPKTLEYLAKNADGAGISIYQQSQNVIRNMIRQGRGGLFVDYPKTEGGASKADLDSLKVFATIQRYEPAQIINWEQSAVGAVVKLSKVVLAETVEENGEDVDIRRELALDYTESESGETRLVYVVREWRYNDGGWYVHDESIPIDGEGNTWDEIPFMFLGSQTNSPDIDRAPMYPICKINIGHYNNSASYEDSVFFVGQAQFWMSGITQDHLDLLDKNEMYVGSGRLIGVPSGEQLGIAQAQPNMLAKEAMADKIQMAIGLGAMYIQPGSAVKTAAQVEGEQQTSHSVLSLIASNLSEAYTQCLHWCARYMNVKETEALEYTVSQDFVPVRADAQMLQAIAASWMQGATPLSDFIAWQQKHGLIDPEKTTEEVIEELGGINRMPDLDVDPDDEDDNEDDSEDEDN